MKNLSWKKIGDAYYLASPAEKLVKLLYEPGNKIVSFINGEVYEVKRSGFWNQRYTVYKNGLEVMSLFHNFWGSKGQIKFLDGTHYTSDYKYKNILTLRFMEGESEILSYHVGMEERKQKVLFTLGIKILDADKLLLLATLGMVMFLNIFNEFNDGGDDAGFLLVTAAAS